MTKYAPEDRLHPQAIAEDIAEYIFPNDTFTLGEFEELDRYCVTQAWFEDILKHVSEEGRKELRAELAAVKAMTEGAETARL